MNLPNFWYGSCSNGLLCENHTLYVGKILVWRNFGPFKAKIWQFLAKIAVFEYIYRALSYSDSYIKNESIVFAKDSLKHFNLIAW